ncbi:MAG: hypothetical protein RR144_03225 [Clostridia bacterium]
MKNEEMLNNLQNPYGITIKKYILLKYILSTIFFIVTLIQIKNIFISIIYFSILFFLPNFLIYTYKKQESLKIINDITVVVNNLNISLTCNIPLYECLKFARNSIVYTRFKSAFDTFVNDYILYNFNMVKAIDNFKLKFDSYELEIFFNIILQGDKEGNIKEALQVFSETLELSYFKYLKYKETKRITFVTISSLISLINITIIAIYPIIIQITENLSKIFS